MSTNRRRGLLPFNIHESSGSCVEQQRAMACHASGNARKALLVLGGAGSRILDRHDCPFASKRHGWTRWLQYGTLTVMMTIGLPDVRDLEMEVSGPEDGIPRVSTNWRLIGCMSAVTSRR